MTCPRLTDDQRCAGSLAATVYATMQYGSPELVLTYACMRCGHPCESAALPSAYRLGEILDAHVATLPETQR